MSDQNAIHDPEMEADVDLEARPRAGTPFENILNKRLSRRGLLKGLAGTGAAAAAAPASAFNLLSLAIARGDISDTLTFTPIEGSTADRIVLSPGYEESVVIRWGDSLTPDVPDLDTSTVIDGALTEPGAAAAQAQQFGYNCDAAEYFPLSEGSNNSSRGLICVNHEYTNDQLLFPTFGDEQSHPLDDPAGDPTFDVRNFVETFPESVPFMKACHGVSVVEIRKVGDDWEYIKDSPFNQRLTGDTPIQITGPAAGHPLLQTSADPTGTVVNGTLNNCAGGQTPYGTYLSAEENFDQYFGNFSGYADGPDADPKVVEFHSRIPLPGGRSRRGWEFGDGRFDVAQEPNEAFRFGWIVEVDPYDPSAPAKKRTAMGRFKHECATTITASSGQLVVYSGDDARMEYVYKFVTDAQVSTDRNANRDILDSGKLYVARFNDDGTGEWLLLDWASQPALQEEFESQAEVLIHTRRAGDVLGATPMDRPEDVEANPVTKRVYVACTNNTRRTFEPGSRNFQGRELDTQPDEQNPRGPNRFGHIMEIIEDGDDNSATSFRWEIFMLCGDPKSAEGTFLTSLDDVNAPLTQNDTYYAGFTDPDKLAPIGSPDNINFDNLGNLWIVTDGSQPNGTHNGCFACPTVGPNRGRLRQFMSTARSSEVCGCEFTPDGKTIFFNIQHPGDRGNAKAPSSYWPDGELPDPDQQADVVIQPRPSLIAVTKRSGTRRIGN